jgi:hypothetical protein
MVPQIDNSISDSINIISYPNKTYKMSETQIAGKVDDLEAIEQTVYHILSVERYACLIYDDNYGVELEKYIGQDLSYLESTIEDTLREALTQDDRILDVQVTDINVSVQKQEMIDKTKLYKKLVDDDTDILITEDSNNLITDKDTSNILSKSETQVVNVKFTVYCKQGVIHKEVKVNV